MKCFLIYFLFFLISFTNIDKSNQAKLKLENKTNLSDQPSQDDNLVRCKICQEMIKYDFNYENLLKDKTKMSQIKSLFNKMEKGNDLNKKDKFSDENLELFGREISMEYFFKGEDAILAKFEENDKKFSDEFSKCKLKEVGLDKDCDTMKINFCEYTLNIKENICYKHYNLINLENKKNINIIDEKYSLSEFRTNQIKFGNNKSQNIINSDKTINKTKTVINDSFIDKKNNENTNENSDENFNIENFKTILKKLGSSISVDTEINKKLKNRIKKSEVKKLLHEGNNKMNLEDYLNDFIEKKNLKKFEVENENNEISLLEQSLKKKINHKSLSEMLFKEIDSLENHEINKILRDKLDKIQSPKFNHRVTRENEDDLPHTQSSYLELSPEYIQKNFSSKPKSNWTPPKPVLLENFEGNIGNQLKEISSLASEISRSENRVKSMKQKLANKIEQFQSSYNVIQKTINEISKLVKNPSFPGLIKSPSSFTEDDWDESSRPKFLNK